MWGDKYPYVGKYGHDEWEGLMLFYGYPKGMRKIIYITNTIEPLSSVIRTMVNKRKMFPSDQAAFKVVYLATQQAFKTCSMLIRNWMSALNRFMTVFNDGFIRYLISMAVTQNSR